MNRHRDFYKDFDQGDIATHPDDFYDEQDADYDHGHGQEEYEFTCEQCGMFALGHADAQTHQFFCRHCWEDYHQSQNQTPQKPQKQQNQSQPQSVPSSSKGKKKNKKKGKGKNNQTTNNNNVNNVNNVNNNTNNKNSNNKANNSKTDKKNSSNNTKAETQTNKDQVLGDRPDFFGGFMDDTAIEENATIIENNSNNNNNISGPISDSSKTSKTSNTDNTTVTSKQEAQNGCNKSIESNKSNKPNKSNKNKNNKQSNKNDSKNETKEEKKDEGYTYHGIRYVGMRIESQKEYLKQQKMKQELICKRFGIDASQLDDTNNNDKSNEKNDKNENKNDDKREKLLKKSKEAKPHINLVVIGHVDAGKSTLMGHLLYKYGKVNAKTMHKYEKQATELNKSSFAYAFVLDVNEEERKRGITVDVSTNYFETENRRVTLLDSPGHKDFVPNMISGTAQADAAILVINANNNEFEAGFSERGQTREHALLAKSLGVSQLIVAINKMDMVDWNFERYKFIVEQLTHFLQKIGFPNKKIVFLPVSGLTGRNLLRAQDISKDSMKKGKNDKNNKDNKDNDNVKNEWYKKESEYNSNLTLIELIDKLRPPSTLRHSIDYPLRMSITDIYRDMMGFMLTGKIYSGSIMTNQQILIQPTNVVCKIKTLLSVEDNTKDFSHNIGVSGDNIQLLVSLQGVSKSDSEMMLEQVKVGDMITVPHEPMQCVKKFECKIATTATLKVPFVKGQDIVVYSHSVDVPARLAKIIGIFDKKGETIVKKNARHVPADTTASVVIKIKGKKQSLCLDTYENHKQLGRVTIRREGETIAIGVVTNTQV